MRAYTVAVREKGKSGAFAYISENLQVVDTATRCKPLSREDAALVKRLFIEGAKKAGRPVDCRIVRLCV